jgi:DNA-directed RNA polymerase specialized sigma24 family protein
VNPAAQFEDVYAELRRSAAARLASESPGQTLDATALVHEAYLRIAGASPQAAFADRNHLLATAAEVIRHILIDRTRIKKASSTATSSLLTCWWRSTTTGRCRR